MTVGCWSGSPSDLRALVAQDEGWPESEGAELLRRRPGLVAVLDLVDAHMVFHAERLVEVVERWSK